jgi:hypothetical protein
MHRAYCCSSSSDGKQRLPDAYHTLSQRVTPLLFRVYLIILFFWRERKTETPSILLPVWRGVSDVLDAVRHREYLFEITNWTMTLVKSRAEPVESSRARIASSMRPIYGFRYPGRQSQITERNRAHSFSHL